MKKGKIVAPIVITVIMIIYFAVYFGVLIWLVPGLWKIVLGILPLAFAAAMIYTCIDRIKEIRSEDDNDISKY